ncbi:G-protein coupled receptor Mth2 [Drosophila grimshawi]|uniref:G-protein coupled receptor Mth2 n=1 Tax=Drosophila grimshawi TaxID=7222 RepID=UPI000C87138B|nr:G-protein coupled receptor Mth2 [Drosophila grimshawi]
MIKNDIHMSASFVFMCLIFSYVITNISSVEICCSPQATLYRIRESNSSIGFECTPLQNGPSKVDRPENMDVVRPQGYNLERNNTNTELQQCARTIHSNISLYTEISVLDVPQKSCLVIMDSRLIVLACGSSNTEENILQGIGIINKCCPHGYTYVSELNKCFSREPDFNLYSHIFNKPMIFVDDAFVCPSNKVLVEYVATAETISLKDSQLTLKDTRKSFTKSQYCIEAIEINKNKSKPKNENTQKFIIHTCQNLKICNALACVRRCCADGEFYSKKNMTTACRRDENDFKFRSFESMSISGNFTKPSEFGILTGLECPKFRLDPDSFPDESHVISSTNGSLFITSTEKMYSNSQYCIEKIRNTSYADQKFYTFVCFDSKVLGNDRIRFKMYPVGLLISCCFYIITLVVYTSIEKLRNLPGKILICLISSLLFAYLGIALGQLMPTSNNDICFISGFLVYFFLMAAFSWMNITCFDIWKTFGSTESSNLQRREQRKRFLWYSLYGWGMPTVLTTITASLSKSTILSDSIRPVFGNGRCWFTYDTIGFASLIFFSGPLGILFVVNLLLFLLTLKYCNKVKREIFRMQSSNAEKHTLRSRFFIDKTRFIMNTKLCFVMGITWLFEIASIFFYDHKKNFFWSISDSFNVLLGVFVFIIFVFKRRVWKEIMIKLGFQSKNDVRRNGNATRLTQSTFVTQSIHMKKLDEVGGNTPILRRTS